MIKKYFDYITHLFLTGLFTLLPIGLTIMFFTSAFRFIKNILEPLQVIKIPYLMHIPHSEIILFILIILLAGIFLKSIVLKSCLDLTEQALSELPIFSTIYKSIKQLTSAFSPTDNGNFKKVVRISFPHQDSYTIGFLTSEFPSSLFPDNKELVSVFVPTTPNPTSGFYLLVPKDNIVILDLTNQEAMTLIMSAGLIIPKRQADL